MDIPTVGQKGTFYTFSNIQKFRDESFKFCFDVLKKAKVAMMPGREFGRFGEGYIRCSYATDLTLIKEAMDRLEKYLRTYHKGRC